MRVRGDELTNFRGRLRLEDGLLTLEDCSFGIYDGTVTAAGTQMEIWKARMPFKANLSVKGVEVNKALSAHTRYGNSLYGKADFDTHLAGDGVETRQLEEKLLGQLTMSLKQGRLGRAGLTESVLGEFKTLEQVPGLNLRVPKVDNALKDLVAQLEVHDGKMTLSRPMAFSLDGNRVTLGGAIGIAGGLFLDGGALIDAATGGRCKSTEELRVPVAVRGRVEAPEFRPNGAAVALALARRCLTGAVGGKVLDALGVGKAADGQAPADEERLKRERLELEKKARDALEGLFRR